MEISSYTKSIRKNFSKQGIRAMKIFQVISGSESDDRKRIFSIETTQAVEQIFQVDSKTKSFCKRLKLSYAIFLFPAFNLGREATFLFLLLFSSSASFGSSLNIRPCAENVIHLVYNCVLRNSDTHNKTHILEIRSAFFECALTAFNYNFHYYKLCKTLYKFFENNKIN